MTEREYERGCSLDFVDENANIIRANDCCSKLDVYNWFGDISYTSDEDDIVEVRFKNTRKGFYKNVNKLSLCEGELIAVEASPGHDIGIVSLTGVLVLEQMKKYKVSPETELRKVYRKARATDIQKWKEAIAREMTTMVRTREMAKQLNLNMKIGDVEFQGDNTKAIFYYIADERVDFRQLIKHMADEFRIRIEMRQIGARQEAGRIGGIGPCGRELCCTTWMTNFVSVTTNSARFQELSPNPQKLAGQCSKLKCCINFEIDVYHDARKHFPRNSDTLYIKNGKAFHVKNDVFKQLMYYDLVVENEPRIIVPVSIQRVKEVISLNQKDEKPEKLVKESDLIAGPQKTEFLDVLSDSNIERFDKGVVKKKRKKKRRNKSSNGNIGKTLGLLILIALFSFSCNKNRVYQKYIEIPNSVWEVGNVAQYEIDISDTISRHNVFVNIRNSSHYPFRNLWLFITTTAPNGFQDMDTFQVILADPNGKWLGDGLGDIWDSKLAYKKNIRFPQTGTYFMEIEQAMRIDKLPGIMDVGVTVEKFSDK